MLASEKIRTEALEVDGKKQIFYTKSNDGWFQTVFVLQGRALDRYIVPLAIVTVNAIIWTVVAEAVLLVQPGAEIVGIEGVLSLVVSTTLAFLQVFRLNRSAERYWVARESWGAVVGVGTDIFYCEISSAFELYSLLIHHELFSLAKVGLLFLGF
jgi:predicted membrane chloride channel (bestrophin family)